MVCIGCIWYYKEAGDSVQRCHAPFQPCYSEDEEEYLDEEQ